MRTGLLCLVLCCIGGNSAAVLAQTPRCEGSAVGQWLGPYSLQPEINADEEGPPYASPRFSEITHAMLLPPPNDGWVLLWCARYCSDVAGAGIPAYKSFLWHPDNPTSVLHVALPLDPNPEGKGDLFCGGQTFSADGDPIVFGGTNLPAACAPGGQIGTGHKKVWLFQNANSLRQWRLNPVDMLRERWYPTAILLPTGKILVVAHTGDPDDPCLPGDPCLPTSFTRERGSPLVVAGQPELDWDAQSGTYNFKNWLIGAGGSCTKDDTLNTGLLGLPDYAQLHVLRNGTVYCIVVGRPDQDQRSALLDFQRCPTDSNEPERWILGPDLAEALTPKVEGSPSLHIVDARDPQDISEILYALAGNEDEGECHESTTNQVLVMTDPSPTTTWSAGPSLAHARNSCNAVIAPDGSLIVFGGLDGNCGTVLEPERLRPPFLFTTGVTSNWEELCPQGHLRAYHSWALVMPDGKLLSGGGKGHPLGHVFGTNSQSIEIYQPSYLFRSARPCIVNWPDPLPTPDNGGELTFEVVLPGTLGGEFRVALLQPAAVTHSFNTNQRYIALELVPPIDLEDPPLTTEVRVSIPGENVAPPGWYMLVVVSSDGVPSIAQWLKVLPGLGG
jgi:hypothetical protein